MADTDLPPPGKSTSIQLVVDGVITQIQDNVTSFTEQEDVDEIVTKPLGKSGSQISQEFVGHNGTAEVTESTSAPQDLQDLVNAARVARVPLVINIVRTTYFNDGSSVTHTYPDCKLTFGRKVSRGEATVTTITWKNGTPRIAS